MATPRKHWFRVEDRIRREPWTNDELALAVRLMAMLNERWARDGKSAEEAGAAWLDAGELASCAGCQSLVRARSTLSRLAARSGLTWRADGTRTLVEWCKYAEIQALGSPSRGKVRAEVSPSAPAPAPAPAEKIREDEEPPRSAAPVTRPDAAKAAKTAGRESAREATRAGRTLPPERLDDSQRAALAAWALGQPPQIAALDAHALAYAEQHVLDWARGKGARKRDWLATVRNAIRDGWALRGYVSPSAPNQTAQRAYHLPFAPMRMPPPPTADDLADLERAREEYARKRKRA